VFIFCHKILKFAVQVLKLDNTELSGRQMATLINGRDEELAVEADAHLVSVIASGSGAVISSSGSIAKQFG